MTGEDVEMKKTMGSLTMDVIASCAFGTKIDTYNDHKTSEFIVNAKKVFHGSPWRIWLFGILVNISPKLLKWTGFQFMDPSVEKFFTPAITAILAKRKSEKVRQRDYLQLMIDAQNRMNIDNEELDVDDLDEEIYGKTESTDSMNNNQNKSNISKS
ncbi:unnamed protein product, partial [Oppiella nova]